MTNKIPQENLFSNHRYYIMIMPDNTGYHVINKATGVIEGEVPVFPQAVAMAEGWAESTDTMLPSTVQNPDTIKLIN